MLNLWSLSPWHLTFYNCTVARNTFRFNYLLIIYLATLRILCPIDIFSIRTRVAPRRVGVHVVGTFMTLVLYANRLVITTFVCPCISHSNSYAKKKSDLPSNSAFLYKWIECQRPSSSDTRRTQLCRESRQHRRPTRRQWEWIAWIPWTARARRLVQWWMYVKFLNVVTPPPELRSFVQLGAGRANCQYCKAIATARALLLFATLILSRTPIPFQSHVFRFKLFPPVLAFTHALAHKRNMCESALRGKKEKKGREKNGIKKFNNQLSRV